MGDVVISPAALSEQVYRPLLASAMLRGTVNCASNPPASPFRASPASSTHLYSATHSASSRAPSTPTSSSAAPSHSSPSHDVPAYVQSSYSDHSDPSPAYPTTMSSSHRMPQPPSSHPAEPMLTTANSVYHSAAEVAPPSAQMHAYPASHIPSPSSPRLHPTSASTKSLGSSVATSPSRIKVRDLSHIQSFASEELLEQAQRARRPGRGPNDVVRQYEISSMPVTDIIEMVAGLLTKITATNDLQHENIHRQIPPLENTANLSPQASSVLAFHGKNVPSITILSYLTRIHKYCPTTYEVFLSLLVYFDRMTELVNRRPIQRRRKRLDSASAMALDSQPHSRNASAHHITVVTPPSSSGIAAQDPKSPDSSITSSLRLDDDDEDDDFSNFFIVDSFNIHRLVIAGVTCASKFFSDVFYTNSRYAKVGGLPLVELNHLELQFLLLNDFRLSITVEELDAYGTMLVEFYAREVVAQQQQQQAAMSAASVGRPLAMDYSGHQHRRHHRHSRDESEYSNHMRTPP